MDAQVSKLSPDVDLSPFRVFDRAEWANLRADTPLTLTLEELKRLQSVNEQLSIEEVAEIYLPLSRLLSLYVAATQGLFKATQRFLQAGGEVKVPYIIGIAGSVAVGKSTTARVLEALLKRWPNTPKVSLVTTDGFLLPNAELTRLGLMERKGFPESYDSAALLKFLARIKAGEEHVSAPLYSHLTYDVMAGEEITVDRPDILIVEGLNVLQPPKLPLEHGAQKWKPVLRDTMRQDKESEHGFDGIKTKRALDAKPIPFVSDFFDFSIYLDADEDKLREWYVDRFMTLRLTAFRKPESFFRRYAEISTDEALSIANALWDGINLPNLRENIFPTRPRADLILRKGDSHQIEEVALRRL